MMVYDAKHPFYENHTRKQIIQPDNVIQHREPLYRRVTTGDLTEREDMWLEEKKRIIIKKLCDNPGRGGRVV